MSLITSEYGSMCMECQQAVHIHSKSDHLGKLKKAFFKVSLSQWLCEYFHVATRILMHICTHIENHFNKKANGRSLFLQLFVKYVEFQLANALLNGGHRLAQIRKRSSLSQT